MRLASARIAFLALALPPGAALAAPLPAEYDADVARIRAWYAASEMDSAAVLAAALVKDARTKADPGALAILLRMEGQLYASFGRPKPAEPLLRESVDLATGVRDSVTLSKGLLWLAVSYEGLGMQPRAAAEWGRLFEVATAIRDSIGIGSALSAFAYDSLQAGRFEGACARYEEAIRLLAASDAPAFELNAKLGWSRALEELGRYDEERACLHEVTERAGAAGLTYDEANAWNNLGALEYSIGDPGTAAACYRRALDLHVGIGIVLPALTTMINIAMAETALGRFASAESLLTSALATSRREGLPAQEGQARSQLGELAGERGRWREALDQYEAGLALSDRLAPPDVADLAVGRARARMELGQIREGADELDAIGLPLRSAFQRERLPFDALRAELRLRNGDPAGALEALRDPVRGIETEVPRLSIPPLVLAARAERALGSAGEAAAYADQALQVWEADRGVPRSPEWRAQRTASGRAVFEELLTQRLAGDAGARAPNASAAFDLLQRFKARTLREQMRVPDPVAATGVAAPGVADVGQVRDALAAGEVLLDLFVGTETSFVFTVTRDTCRVDALPGGAHLEARARLLGEYVASPPGGDRSPDIVTDAARALGSLLLAGVGVDAAHVLVSPDGALHRLPVALLRLPDGASLLDRCDVTVVPSASILVDLRRRAALEPERSGRAGVVVVQGPDAGDGERLVGVEHEVRDLARRYAGVTVLGGAQRRDPRRWTSGAPGVLHVAAHSVVDDERPWRAGVRLGAATPGDDPYVRADALLGTEWPQRLVVLSSCESAGGRARTGEGVEGLAVAFLTGGVEAAVATLWPVDDRAAAEFNRHLYAGLAQGASVAAAVRAAQRVMSRGARWHDPFYWAGYVVIGNGEVSLPLRSRPWLLREWKGLAAVLALIAGLALAGRRTVA